MYSGYSKINGEKAPMEITIGKNTPLILHVTKKKDPRVLENRKENKSRSVSFHPNILSKKDPFYPSPSLSHKVSRSLRQGATRHQPDATLEMRITDDINGKELHGFSSKVKEYEEKVTDLSQTIDGLREDIDMERSMRMLGDQEDLLGKYRRELADASSKNKATLSMYYLLSICI